MADAAKPTTPRGLEDALSTLNRVVNAVLRRLPAQITARCALAYSRAPWWEEGEAVGLVGATDLLFAPATSEWPEQVKSKKAEMEHEEEGSAILRFFRRGDLATLAFGNILANAVAGHDPTARTKSFVSRAFRASAYDLVAIVEFDLDAYDRYPAFAAPSAKGDGEILTVGLLDAGVRAALGWYGDKMSQGLSDRHYAFHGDVDSIMRNAATLMLAGVQRVVSAELRMRSDLFLSLDSISALRHEGADCRASILVTSPERIDALQPLKFQEDVPIREALWIRKLLEMADPPFSAISDGDSVAGLGKPTFSADSETREFTIQFDGHHRWSLAAGRRTLVEFRVGFPGFPAEPLGRKTFRNTFERVFPGRTDGVDNIWRLIEAILADRHGALVVVTDDAQQEAERLARQSTSVVAMQLSPEQASKVSRMDGAVLLDPAGICHAVGVILDGEAVEAGSRTRGARFNSAIRYVYGAPGRLVYGAPGRLAVVHSEDGHVDLLPRLRPQVRRSDLEKDLAKIRDADRSVVDRKEFGRMAERIALYAVDLDVSDDDWKLVVPFLIGSMDIFDHDPPRPEFDPHSSDFLPEG